MHMIQTFCLKFLCIFMISSTAFAQDMTTPQAFPWPKTFVGEADFDFIRTDVIDEYKKKKGNDADKYIVTFPDLLDAKKIDPFVPRPKTADIGRSKYSKNVYEQRFSERNQHASFRSKYPDIKPGTGVNILLRNGLNAKAKLVNDTQADIIETGERIEIAVNNAGDIIEVFVNESISESFKNLFTTKQRYLSQEDIKTKKQTSVQQLKELPAYQFSVDDLPEIGDVSIEVRKNLEEFAIFLGNIIRQARKNDYTAINEKELKKQLTEIVLQSVAASPFSYAIINNTRYQQGDRLAITLSRGEKSADALEKVINTYMPSQTGLPEEIYSQYVLLKEKALSEYSKTDFASPKTAISLEKSYKIYAIIEHIGPRHVILNINNRRYPLTVRVAL